MRANPFRTYPTTSTLAGALIGIYVLQWIILPGRGIPQPIHLHFAVSTTEPFDIVSYITAAVTHIDTFHLGRNLFLLVAGGVIVERVVGRAELVGLFVLAAIVGTATFAITGHIDGVSRHGAGASGGTYAMVAFAGLVVVRHTIWVRDYRMTIPLWSLPLVLIGIELCRVGVASPFIDSSPYSNYAHIAGVCFAVIVWVVSGRPRRGDVRRSRREPVTPTSARGR